MLALLFTLASQVLPTGPCVPTNVRPVRAPISTSSPDVSAQLDAALQSATAAGRPLYLPPGTYRIASPIHPGAGAVLFGDAAGGTTIQAVAQQWPITSGMIEIAGVSNVRICGITLDQQGTNPNQTLSFVMVLSNTASDFLQNIRFINLGLTGSFPTGPALLMIARQRGDTPYFTTERLDVGQLGSVQAVRVEGCTFDLPASTGLGFAIRIYSEFEVQRTLAQTTANNRGHLITGSSFTGQYFWNSIEFAGRGTRQNIVENNTFSGRTLAHVDFDKGASSNIARGNHVLRAGRPDMTYSVPVRAAAFADHGKADTYRNTDNQISDNVIDVMDRALYVDEGGIYLQYTRGSYVTNNRVLDVVGGTAAVGLVLNGDVSGATITGNTIGASGVTPARVMVGIWTPPSAVGMDDNYLWWNTISTVRETISVGPGATACPTTSDLGTTWTGWDIESNVLSVSDSRYNGVAAVLSAPWIGFNTVRGGSSGMFLATPGGTVAGNDVSGTVGPGYVVQLPTVTFSGNTGTTLCALQCTGASSPAGYCH